MSGNDDDQFQPPSPTGYQISGDIMVTAIIVLFAVVFVMVLLHVYAQCYVNRRRRRENSNLAFHVDPTNPSTAGLDSTILKTLPVFSFSDDQKLPECAVCLSEFSTGEKGRLLPNCGHTFHVDCIDMWFHSHSTCPLCRTLVDGNFPPPAGDVSESTQSDPTHPELPASSNLGGRRKRVDLAGVSVEIPARVASSGFPNSDELGSASPAGQVLKSPASRLVSLKRILSRGKKPIPSPTGTSCAEMVEMEEGRAEIRSRSQASTPR